MCRSLLQKAVRRGYPDLVEAVVLHLDAIGDLTWLKQRMGVITFEECWPAGESIPYPPDLEGIILQLRRVSKLAKWKDAAGLGSLAYVLSQDDPSVLDGTDDDVAIRWVEKGVRVPKRFWGWALAQSEKRETHEFVEQAHAAFQRGGWPWDKAFIIAAVYLALEEELPAEERVIEAPSPGNLFPFWAAIDKHTPEGKIALRTAAKQVGVSYEQLSWVSFYFESAVCNQLISSRWWSKEVMWRLRSIGLEKLEAEDIWDRSRPVLQELLQDDVKGLEEHIQVNELPEMKEKTQITTQQLTLF